MPLNIAPISVPGLIDQQSPLTDDPASIQRAHEEHHGHHARRIAANLIRRRIPVQNSRTKRADGHENDLDRIDEFDEMLDEVRQLEPDDARNLDQDAELRYALGNLESQDQNAFQSAVDDSLNGLQEKASGVFAKVSENYKIPDHSDLKQNARNSLSIRDSVRSLSAADAKRLLQILDEEPNSSLADQLAVMPRALRDTVMSQLKRTANEAPGEKLLALLTNVNSPKGVGNKELALNDVLSFVKSLPKADAQEVEKDLQSIPDLHVARLAMSPRDQKVFDAALLQSLTGRTVDSAGSSPVRAAAHYPTVELRPTVTTSKSALSLSSRIPAKIDIPVFAENRLPRMSDVRQNPTGDTWFLAALQAVLNCKEGPELVKDMVTEHGSDSVSVRLFDKNGRGYNVKMARNIVFDPASRNGGHAMIDGATGSWPGFFESALTAFDREGNLDPDRAGDPRTMSGDPGQAFQHLLSTGAAREEIKAPPERVFGSHPVGNLGFVNGKLLRKVENRPAAQTFRREEPNELRFKGKRKKQLNLAISQAVLHHMQGAKTLSGNYSTDQLDLFNKIDAALNRDRPVCLSTRDSVTKSRKSARKGHRTVEPRVNALTGQHAYAVLATRIDDETGRRFVRLMNPWGRANQRNASLEVAEGSFEIELDDLSRRFSTLYTGN